MRAAAADKAPCCQEPGAGKFHLCLLSILAQCTPADLPQAIGRLDNRFEATKSCGRHDSERFPPPCLRPCCRRPPDSSNTRYAYTAARCRAAPEIECASAISWECRHSCDCPSNKSSPSLWMSKCRAEKWSSISNRMTASRDTRKLNSLYRTLGRMSGWPARGESGVP